MTIPPARLGALGLTILLGCGAASPPTGTSPAPAARSGPIRHVILVTIDGLPPAAYLEPDAHGLQVPMLRRMLAQGAASSGMESVFPSVTYPAHTTLITGANPGTHGIVTNTQFDPLDQNLNGWRWYAEDIRVPTLLDAARAAGLRTAAVAWPVTVGASADFLVPDYWRAGVAEDVKLLRALSTPGLLEAAAARFPGFREGFLPKHMPDAASTDLAVHMLETHRPALLLLHIYEVDEAQHTHGPLAPETRPAIENADRQIARLEEAARRAGIWDQTVLVVASDHGFARIERLVRPGALLYRAGLVTLDPAGKPTSWRANVIASGGLAYVYLANPDDAAARAATLEALSPLAARGDVARVIEAQEIRDRGGDPQAALALAAADGVAFAGGYVDPPPGPIDVRGHHGFEPNRPEMLASLLFYGPRVSPARLGPTRLLDVGPTIAGLLGLELSGAQGKPLPISLAATP